MRTRALFSMLNSENKSCDSEISHLYALLIIKYNVCLKEMHNFAH